MFSVLPTLIRHALDAMARDHHHHTRRALGIVGATGSGKSALLELISRLADPTAGRVLLDGVDLRNLPLAVLRREIGFVPQESLLFSETLADNLAYGTAIGSDARWAAGVAQLVETIEQCPGGWETMLDERGIDLSGGQKRGVRRSSHHTASRRSATHRGSWYLMKGAWWSKDGTKSCSPRADDTLSCCADNRWRQSLSRTPRPPGHEGR